MEVRACGIYKKEDRILLVLHQKTLESYWVLPGGHVDQGETPEQALVREWKEELDIELKEIFPLAVATTVGGRFHRVEFFFSVRIKKLKLTETREVAEAKLFPLEKLEEIDFRPRPLIPFLRELKPQSFRYLGNLYQNPSSR